MVTHKVDNQTPMAMPTPDVNSTRSCKTNNDSNSSDLRLLENEQQPESSCPSVSRNSVYKLKIDLMFDDTRSVRSNHLDDPHGSHRTRSIIMYGRSELAKAGGAGGSGGGGDDGGDSGRSITNYLHDGNENANILADKTKKDVQRISNSVQAQIEQLFNDVAKDAVNTFAVTCLGSLPLKEKINSLQGLQKPLRDLYCRDRNGKELADGVLEICSTGLHIKIASTESQADLNSTSTSNEVTLFQNIAVWSAVKFIISSEEGGAAFLPLITSPDNIDKKSLFQPLSSNERKNLPENPHAPIFAVVMRSTEMPKVLECHAYICKTTEEAIIIAATLYQSLMSHVNQSTQWNTKRRNPPRNQNGVSCISIASSSALTGSNNASRSYMIINSRKSSLRGSLKAPSTTSLARSGLRKRISNTLLNSTANIIKETVETSTEERKRKSYKMKRAPPIPPSLGSRVTHCCGRKTSVNKSIHDIETGKHSQRHKALQKRNSGTPVMGGSISAGLNTVTDCNGDILTRVAIPRSGSFLNTAGLTRYKSRSTHRYSNKLGESVNDFENGTGGDMSVGSGGGGGGGGSPLGFSELFNEFRLHENLHSLDDILYAIINSDGMSFNDLKPIYKEFLLKLAVTLTKDELFQRSKNIMRRQKKKKRKTNSLNGSQRKTKGRFFNTNNLKSVFRLDQFRFCKGKLLKLSCKKEPKKYNKSSPIMIGGCLGEKQYATQHHTTRHNRLATSGSDVSVIRHDNTFHRINRNSSSGYVSCSECSYDSEACTCTSADRCYCSLRARKNNAPSGNNIRKRHERRHLRRNDKLKAKIDSKNNHSKNVDRVNNRDSYVSCKSDEKCYCSMVEEEIHNGNKSDKNENDDKNDEDDGDDDDDGDDGEEEEPDEQEREILHSDNRSETTWCDTDSCKSASKCYCKKVIRTRTVPVQENNNNLKKFDGKRNKASDKLALDYELFKINSKSKSVQPNEALSVKKSVEAAAIFADVKLSQTTDITSLASSQIANLTNITNIKNSNTRKSYSISARRQYTTQNKVESLGSFIRRHNESNCNGPRSVLQSDLQRASSSDDLLNKLSCIERNLVQTASIHNERMKSNEIVLNEKFPNNYQSMRAISASLEDSLGYLP